MIHFGSVETKTTNTRNHHSEETLVPGKRLIFDTRTLAVDAYRLVLCAGVGAITGLVAIGFRFSVRSVSDGLQEAIHLLEVSHHPTLARVVLVSAPALGGLIVGLLVYRFVRVRAGHGVPAVIAAAAADTPMTDWRMGFKAATSVITIGSGCSAGPEGPIVELGAVVGSFAWRIFRLPGQWVRIMMGCGAAAGIAAVFNVPLGGVIFVLDVVLRDHSARSLLPLMIASMAASTVNRYAGTPAVQFPEFHVVGNEMLCAPLLGLVAGVASTLFIRANFWAADWFKRLPVETWARPAVGGLCVGLLGLLTLRVFGEGYDAIQQMVQEASTGQVVAIALAGVVLARIAATAFTLGSGGTGGAFAPSLVIGTAVGLCMASVITTEFPSIRLDPTAFALAGIAGLLAGVFQAPLSGLVIAFNLSRWNAQLLLPLMCVAVISAWLSQHLARASIYELGLLRDGADLAASRSLQTILAGRGIRELLQTPVTTVSRDATLGQVIDAVSRTHQTIFPVLDQAERLCGVIRLSELRGVLRETQIQETVIAADLMQPLESSLSPADSLAKAWEFFLESADDEALVLDPSFAAAGPALFVSLIRRSDVVRHVRWR
jgi:CIC family chloride channel protein